MTNALYNIVNVLRNLCTILYLTSTQVPATNHRATKEDIPYNNQSCNITLANTIRPNST